MTMLGKALIACLVILVQFETILRSDAKKLIFPKKHKSSRSHFNKLSTGSQNAKASNTGEKRDFSFSEKNRDIYFVNTPNCTLRIDQPKRSVKSGYPEPKIIFNKSVFDNSAYKDSTNKSAVVAGVSTTPEIFVANLSMLQKNSGLNYTEEQIKSNNSKEEVQNANLGEIGKKSTNKTNLNENSESIDNAFNEIVNEEALDALNHFVNSFIGEETKNHSAKNQESDMMGRLEEKGENQTSNSFIDETNSENFEKQNETEYKTKSQTELISNEDTKKTPDLTANLIGGEKSSADTNQQEEGNSFNKQVINEVIHKLFLARNDEDKLSKLLKNESLKSKENLDTLKKSDLATHNELEIHNELATYNESSFVEVKTMKDTPNKEIFSEPNPKVNSEKRDMQIDSRMKSPNAAQKVVRIDMHAQQRLMTFIQRYRSYINSFYKHVHQITHNPEFWKNVSKEYNVQNSLKRYLVFGKYQPGPLVRAFLKLSPNYKDVLQNAIEKSSDPKVQQLLRLSSAYKAVLRAAIRRWPCYVSGSNAVTGSKKDNMIINEDTDIAEELEATRINNPTRDFLFHLLDNTANPSLEATPIHYYQQSSTVNQLVSRKKVNVLDKANQIQSKSFDHLKDSEELEQSKMEGPIFIVSGNRKRPIPDSGMEYIGQKELDIEDLNSPESSLVNEDEENFQDESKENSKYKTKIIGIEQSEKNDVESKSETRTSKPAAIHIYEDKGEYNSKDPDNPRNVNIEISKLVNFTQNNFKENEEDHTHFPAFVKDDEAKFYDEHLFASKLNKYTGNVANTTNDGYVEERNEKEITRIDNGNQIVPHEVAKQMEAVENSDENLFSDGILMLDGKSVPDSFDQKGGSKFIKLEQFKSSSDLSNDHQNSEEISYYENQLKQLKKEEAKEYLSGIPSKRVAMPTTASLNHFNTLQDASLNSANFNILKLIARSQRISLPNGFRTSWIRNSTEKLDQASSLPLSKSNFINGVKKLEKNVNSGDAIVKANHSSDEFEEKNDKQNKEKDFLPEADITIESASDEMKEDITKQLSNSLQYYGEGETLLSELTKQSNKTNKDEDNSANKETSSAAQQSEGSENFVNSLYEKKSKEKPKETKVPSQSHASSRITQEKTHSNGRTFDSNDRDNFSIRGIKKKNITKKRKT